MLGANLEIITPPEVSLFVDDMRKTLSKLNLINCICSLSKMFNNMITLYLTNTDNFSNCTSVVNFLENYKNFSASNPCNEFLLFVELFDNILNNKYTFESLNDNDCSFDVNSSFDPLSINSNIVYNSIKDQEYTRMSQNELMDLTTCININCKQLMFMEKYQTSQINAPTFQYSLNQLNYDRIVLEGGTCHLFPACKYPENYVMMELSDECKNFIINFLIKFIIYFHKKDICQIFLDFFNGIIKYTPHPLKVKSALKNPDNNNDKIDFESLNLRYRLILSLLSFNYCSAYSHQEALSSIECYLNKKDKSTTLKRPNPTSVEDHGLPKKVRFLDNHQQPQNLGQGIVFL